jgi:rubrerythrin
MTERASHKRLDQEPKARPRDLPELMSLALAMEQEAVRRYSELAAHMEKLGESALAATMLALLEEERDHIAEITRWCSKLTGGPPNFAERPWVLPPEIGRSWEEATASARLTPYRALGIAVLNEERGFAFYSYIAASSNDARVQTAAEKLAAEELRHAAILRRERRRAYRRERAAADPDLDLILSAASLPDFIRQSQSMEADAALRHSLIADRLRALREHEAAETVAKVMWTERQAAALSETEFSRAKVAASLSLPQESTSVGLLRAALAEAERLHDAYIDLGDKTRDEEVLAAAQAAATRTMHNLASLAAALHGRTI